MYIDIDIHTDGQTKKQTDTYKETNKQNDKCHAKWTM